MEVLCVVDGTPFLAKRSTAKYCSERCKKQAQRDPERRHIGPDSGTAGRPASLIHFPGSGQEPATTLGRVASLTQAALVAAGRENTVLGAIAVALALKMDEPGLDTGSSVAAVARQLDLALTRALDGTDRVETPLEKIRRERELRAG